MVDLAWSCQKQTQCAEKNVNIISTYPITLEWSFSCKKINLIENCEKNDKH